MKFLSFTFKRILYPASGLFTLIWILVCLVIDAITDTVNVNLSSSLMCLCIALALAGCNLILHNSHMSFVARYFLHMVLSVFSISLIVAIFSALFKNLYSITSRSFYLVLILIVLYLVLATPVIILYNKHVLSKK